MAHSEKLLMIEGKGARLAGMLHLPGSQRRNIAFLFCHPFAEEKKNSHRAFVELARGLASAGCGVLRFDYRGCGDSEGDFGQSSLSTRLADIQTALRFLTETFPACEVGMLGLRLGGTLAAVSASEHPEVRRLALIEPLLSGGSYFAGELRRLLIRQMIIHGKSRTTRQDITSALEKRKGSLDMDGYTVSAALYAELTELDMNNVPKTGARSLIIQISPRDALKPGLRKLADQYRRAGAEVAVRSLTIPPLWNRLDVADSGPLTEAVTAWLKGSP